MHFIFVDENDEIILTLTLDNFALTLSHSQSNSHLLFYFVSFRFVSFHFISRLVQPIFFSFSRCILFVLFSIMCIFHPYVVFTPLTLFYPIVRALKLCVAPKIWNENIDDTREHIPIPISYAYEIWWNELKKMHEATWKIFIDNRIKTSNDTQHILYIYMLRQHEQLQTLSHVWIWIALKWNYLVVCVCVCFFFCFSFVVLLHTGTVFFVVCVVVVLHLFFRNKSMMMMLLCLRCVIGHCQSEIFI